MPWCLAESLHPLCVIPLLCPHPFSHLHQCHLVSWHQKYKPIFSGDGRSSTWSFSIFLLSDFSPGTQQQNQVQDETEMPLLSSLTLCLILLGHDHQVNQTASKPAQLHPRGTWGKYRHEGTWPCLKLCVAQTAQMLKDGVCAEMPCRMDLVALYQQ